MPFLLGFTLYSLTRLSNKTPHNSCPAYNMGEKTEKLQLNGRRYIFSEKWNITIPTPAQPKTIQL